MLCGVVLDGRHGASMALRGGGKKNVGCLERQKGVEVVCFWQESHGRRNSDEELSEVGDIILGGGSGNEDVISMREKAVKSVYFGKVNTNVGRHETKLGVEREVR